MANTSSRTHPDPILHTLLSYQLRPIYNFGATCCQTARPVSKQQSSNMPAPYSYHSPFLPQVAQTSFLLSFYLRRPFFVARASTISPAMSNFVSNTFTTFRAPSLMPFGIALREVRILLVRAPALQAELELEKAIQSIEEMPTFCNEPLSSNLPEPDSTPRLTLLHRPFLPITINHWITLLKSSIVYGRRIRACQVHVTSHLHFCLCPVSFPIALYYFTRSLLHYWVSLLPPIPSQLRNSLPAFPDCCSYSCRPHHQFPWRGW